MQYNEGYLPSGSAYYQNWGNNLLLISNEGEPLAKYNVVGVVWHPEYGILCHGDANGILRQFNEMEEEFLKVVFFEYYDSTILLNSLINNIEFAQRMYDAPDFQMLKTSGMN